MTERSRIHREGDEGSKLGDMLAQQVAPGAYLNGQRLVATRSWYDSAEMSECLELVFEGDWDLRIAAQRGGGMKVELVENKVFWPSDSKPGPAESTDTIEGEAEDADWEPMVEEGKRLLRGINDEGGAVE